MGKKNFSIGIDSILKETIPPKAMLNKLASNENLDKKKAEERTSVTLDAELLEKLRAVAFWERSTIKIEVENAIDQYLNGKGHIVIEKALKSFRARKVNQKKNS